jgi:hypothetical protein
MQYVGAGHALTLLYFFAGQVLYLFYLWSLIKLLRKTGHYWGFVIVAVALDVLSFRFFPQSLRELRPEPASAFFVILFLGFTSWPRPAAPGQVSKSLTT